MVDEKYRTHGVPQIRFAQVERNSPRAECTWSQSCSLCRLSMPNSFPFAPLGKKPMLPEGFYGPKVFVWNDLREIRRLWRMSRPSLSESFMTKWNAIVIFFYRKFEHHGLFWLVYAVLHSISSFWSLSNVSLDCIPCFTLTPRSEDALYNKHKLLLPAAENCTSDCK